MEGKEKTGRDDCDGKPDLSAAWKMVELVDWNIANKSFFKTKSNDLKAWNILQSFNKEFFYNGDVNIFRVDLRTFYNCFIRKTSFQSVFLKF